MFVVRLHFRCHFEVRHMCIRMTVVRSSSTRRCNFNLRTSSPSLPYPRTPGNPRRSYSEANATYVESMVLPKLNAKLAMRPRVDLFEANISANKICLKPVGFIYVLGRQPRSQVLSPTRLSLSRSVGTGRREPWEPGCTCELSGPLHSKVFTMELPLPYFEIMLDSIAKSLFTWRWGLSG